MTKGDQLLLQGGERVHGRSYIYAKMQVRTHLGQNMERFYHNADGFLMLHVMCTKRVCRIIINFSNSNFGHNL